MNPDVLLVVVDSLRADRISNDDRDCRTPNLDEFRRSATTFTNAFSVASITTVCTASILTGSYPFVHGMHSLAGRRLRPDLGTLADVFKSAGYYTWAEMTGPLEDFTGLSRGFDEYRCRRYTAWLDTAFGDELVTRLRTRAPRPHFGYVHLWEVHYPRRVTRRYNRSGYGRLLYDRAVSSLDNQLARIFDAVRDETIVIVTSDHGEFLPDSRRDELLTRLKGPTAWVKRRVPGAKRLRRSLMPFFFKHMHADAEGGSHAYRAWLGHGFHVYDSLVHVPLIVRAPGFLPGGVEVPSLVSHVDLLPTLASMLEVDCPLPPEADGLDLMDSFRHRNGEGRSDVYLQASGARRMNRPDQWLAGLRTGRYKYVRGMFNDGLPEELYDLEHDSHELENVVARFPDVATEMRTRLTSLLTTGEPSTAMEETAYTAEEQEVLEQRLRDLGYLE